MTPYEERTYRERVCVKDLVSFGVVVKETDLWVSAGRDLEKETRDLVLDCRHQLETYIRSHPEFSTTLLPYEQDPLAPPLVKEMIEATREVGVGPMASVAGAIAQHVGSGLLELTDQVIIENGGDIFLRTKRDVTVSLFAGTSPLSEKLGLLIHVPQMPLGICSSSGTVGHSFSGGVADLVCLLSSSAALADGAATALGNRVKRKSDLERVAEWGRRIDEIRGGLVIIKDQMATWGDIELVGL